MTYNKEIHHRDLLIYFEYNFTKEKNLKLINWTAYNRQDEEVKISCQLESDLIEKKLNNLLDLEYSNNGSNYENDLIDFEQEKRYYKNWKEDF